MNGGDGDDFISGGAGADILIGGAGKDTFLIDITASGVVDGANKIIDFEVGRDGIAFKSDNDGDTFDFSDSDEGTHIEVQLGGVDILVAIVVDISTAELFSDHFLVLEEFV